MLNWYAILRRVMSLYNVKTQQELGMALGAPMSLGMEDGAEPVIPWPILELVKGEKSVSWDWLLTGRDWAGADGSGAANREERTRVLDSPAAAGPPTGNAAAAKAGLQRTLPRFQTRELARELLASEDAYGAERALAEMETAAASPDATVRELENIRAAMRQEVARVERIIQEKKRG